MSAQAILETEVRELVRRRGIDPIADPATVVRLVEDVVSDYRDRAITAALPPVGDAAAISRAVIDAVSGFGPLQPLLDDPTIEEIWINDRLTHTSRKTKLMRLTSWRLPRRAVEKLRPLRLTWRPANSRLRPAFEAAHIRRSNRYRIDQTRAAPAAAARR